MNWLIYRPGPFGDNDNRGERKHLERTGAMLLSGAIELWLNPPDLSRPFFLPSDNPDCGSEPPSQRGGHGARELLRAVDHQLRIPVGYRLMMGYSMLRDDR